MYYLCSENKGADQLHSVTAQLISAFVFDMQKAGVIMTWLILYSMLFQVRMMNELLTCIKLVKMYAWEKSFAKAIAGEYCCIYDKKINVIFHKHTDNKTYICIKPIISYT